MSKDTSGPAFPVQDDDRLHGDTGMTLRDYFAAQALPFARSTLPDYELNALFGGRGGIRREEIIAADAYRLADAMLAERAKGSDG